MALSLLNHRTWLLSCVLLFASVMGTASDKVLVVSTDSSHFVSARESLGQELADEFELIDFLVEKSTKPDRLAAQISRVKPRMLVLFNNSSITLYRRYLDTIPDVKPLPTLAMMAVYLDNSIKELPDITGIRYEIDGVIFLTNLRYLSSKPASVKRVGVLYRPLLKEFIHRQALVCASEEITVVGYEIPNESKKIVANIGKGLKQLIKKDKVDALWLLNDSALFTPDTMTKVWLKTIRNMDIPVVVGIEKWVEGNGQMGHFAVVPDHIELGVQAADMVFEIRDNGWSTEGIDVANPVSVKKILNKKALPKDFKLDPDAVLDLDIVHE